MLNVIKTQDGRYIRVRPFFGANLEKTKKPYKKVMYCLNRLIKLMEKLPNSFELLAKLKEHKALIYRANRCRTATKEFNALSDEINRSETAIRRIIDAYIAGFSFEEKIRFANEIALLKDFWTDVVAEWAEYVRVRAEAIREGLNVLQEAYKRALEENGIPVADIPKFEFKASEELDEETNPNADSPKKPYVWANYFKLDRRATLRHVLKYMSRRPVQDIALYCYKHGDAPKLPYDWLNQLINYKNQRIALGLARENYALMHTAEEVKKLSKQFNELEEKFNQITAQHPEFAEQLAQIAEPLADAKKCVEELGKMLEKGKPPAQETFTYIETAKFALEKIQQTNVFNAEELKEKQKQLAELNKQKAEIETIRFECESVKREIEQLEDWIKSGIEREGDRERLAELQKKRDELEQKLTELSPTEQKIAQEMHEILKTLDVAKQTAEFQEEAHKAQTAIEQIENELKEDRHYCPVCGRITAKPKYLTTDMLAEKVEKGLVLYYIDPETRRARLCVSSKAPNAREVVSYFAIKSYTARAMLELEKTRYADKVVYSWFV
jgi:DNA repair exonuclease SbcCD ATPase subunit